MGAPWGWYPAVILLHRRGCAASKRLQHWLAGGAAMQCKLRQAFCFPFPGPSFSTRDPCCCFLFFRCFCLTSYVACRVHTTLVRVNMCAQDKQGVQSPRVACSEFRGRLQACCLCLHHTLTPFHPASIDARCFGATLQDKEAAAASTTGGEEGPQEVAGLLFGRLIERAPALRAPLLELRDRLHAAAAPEEELKARNDAS